MERLGPAPPRLIDALVVIGPDGEVAVTFSGWSGEPGAGWWRPAGPMRSIVVVQWFARDWADDALPTRWLTVRAAAELCADGSRFQARLRWQRFDRVGQPRGNAVTGEAEGHRHRA